MYECVFNKSYFFNVIQSMDTQYKLYRPKCNKKINNLTYSYKIGTKNAKIRKINPTQECHVSNVNLEFLIMASLTFSMVCNL